MELSEVVNPHFAFPVVGVVVCAFLVFAFGFKSPVQPPSFDFDSADDGKRKKAKTKKKPHSNGQVTSTDAISVVVKPTVGTKHQTPASKNVPVLEKNQKAQKEAKTKVKKVTVKSSSITQDMKRDSHENDGSGWETVSLPKKKKNKGRKDGDMSQGSADPVSGDDQPKPTVSPQNAPVTAQVAVVDELPQQQREKRDRPSKGHLKETVSEVDASNKKTTAEQVTTPDKSDSHFEVVSTKDKKKDGDSGSPEFVGKSDTSKLNQKKTPAPAMPKQSKPVTPDRAKPAAQNKTQASLEMEITPDKSKSGNAPATESKQGSTVAQSTQAAKSSSSVDVSKDSKSPKKKKEKVKKEAAPSVAVGSSQASPASVSGTIQEKVKVPSSAQDITEVVSRESTVVLPSAGADKSTPEDGATAAKDSSTITFDEMGDWQEAKTIKKRKPKARRDN